MLIESAWLTSPCYVLRSQGGVLITYACLSMEVLSEIGAELAILEDLEEE
jgi:hypothetical protein